jgi:hypothetical protein
MNEDARWPIAVGDQVRIWSGGRGDRLGTIRAIGPKLVHVFDGHRVTKYFRETRLRHDGLSGSFETLLQHADRTAADVAHRSLRDYGITVDSTKWTTEQLQLLARFVESMHVPAKVA